MTMRTGVRYVLLLALILGVVLIPILWDLPTKLLEWSDPFFVAIALGMLLCAIAEHKDVPTRQSGGSEPRPVPPSVEARRRELRSSAALASTTLSPERRREIVETACAAFPHAVALRARHLEAMRRDLAGRLRESRTEIMTTPAWWAIAPTRSDTGHRFVMGFRNLGCAYWRDDPFHLGCSCCGFCSGVVPDVEPTRQDLEAQFANALADALDTGVHFDVVEFLNDGSFLNDDEFAPAFRQHLFRTIAALPYVRRVLIETRPEYITEDKVLAVLGELRDGQRLEVAIGLETADEFIRAACHRKGFGREDFEAAARCLSSVGERVGILVYSLVKPAFLSEAEAIEDQVSTARYLAELSARYGCTIAMKLEPAVVAKGTLLDFLYFDGTDAIGHGYDVLSYWSVVEILCRLAQEAVGLPVRVGTREDMDIFEKVPAVYHANGMFSKWDFILYGAVQHYNTHGSPARLLAEIGDAVSDRSFPAWKARLGLRTTAIEQMRSSLAEDIAGIQSERGGRARRAFLRQVFAGLERLEYGGRSLRFARELRGRGRLLPDADLVAGVHRLVESELSQVLSGFSLKVLDARLERDAPGLLRICLQIKDSTTRDSLHHVWFGIPTDHLTA